MSDTASDSKGTDSAVGGSAKEQLRFTDEQFIWRFSPNQTDPKLLEAIFVGREPLLQNVLEKIADSATSGSTHHVLLYGPRGIGKSHFTSLLHHRLLGDPKLSDAVHIAHLNEDETTTSMVQLLVRIYRSLCKAYPDEYSAEWLDELLNQPPDEIAGVLTRRLVARFEKRTLVILVENLNLLFENVGKDGQHELRTLLQEHPFACLIATSQQLFKAVTDRSEPFFGFFQQIPLKPLSLQDAQQLLATIASAEGQDDLAAFLNTPDGRGRVRAIHDLAGGNHRVYIVLSGFVTRESLDQLVAPFQKLADDLTPYYQERLRWISPMQRQIVELLCREHRTLNPKEIARRLLVDQRTIGKQVRILVEIGYLTATKRGRETFYELSEPLMRLAYEVKEQSLLKMLVEFLRVWYRPDELVRLRNLRGCDTAHEYIDAALERSRMNSDSRLKLINSEIANLRSAGLQRDLPEVLEEKAAITDQAGDWYEAAEQWEIMDEATKALSCYAEAIRLKGDFVSALSHKARCLNDLGMPTDALAAVNEALAIDPGHSCATVNKGLILHSLGRFEDALTSVEGVLQVKPNYAYAWNAKAYLLLEQRRYQDALSCLDKASEIDPEDVAPRVNRSEALFAVHRWVEGFDAIRDALANPGSTPDYLGDVASMFSLIFRLSEDDRSLQSRISELVDLYQQAADERGFRRPDQGAQRRRSSNNNTEDESQKDAAGAALRSVRPTVNPLSHLADGLVKSLSRIDAERVTPTVLESYVTAVEQRVADMPEFEISLRLFRYGIRYLISGKESEFVELIQPERRIVRQALGLDQEE